MIYERHKVIAKVLERHWAVPKDIANNDACRIEACQSARRVLKAIKKAYSSVFHKNKKQSMLHFCMLCFFLLAYYMYTLIFLIFLRHEP